MLSCWAQTNLTIHQSACRSETLICGAQGLTACEVPLVGRHLVQVASHWCRGCTVVQEQVKIQPVARQSQVKVNPTQG